MKDVSYRHIPGHVFGCLVCGGGCRVIPYQGILSQNRKLCPNLHSSASPLCWLLTSAHSGSHNLTTLLSSLAKQSPPSRPTLLNHVPSTAHLHRPVSASRQWPGPGVMVILLWTRRQPGHVVYCCKCLIITLRFGSLPTRDYNYISARI